MKLTLKYLTIALYFLVSATLNAQVSQTKRVEIELKEEYSGQTTYLFGEEGLILFSSSRPSSEEESILKFEKFNTDLKKIGEKEVAFYVLKDGYKTFSENNNFWMMSYDYKKGEFNLMKYNIIDQSVKHYNGILTSKFRIDFFKVLNENIYFGGQLQKKQPYLAVYNFKTNTQNYIDLEGFSKNSAITDIVIVQNPLQVHVQLFDCEIKKECDYLLIPFTQEGKQISAPIILGDYEGNKLTSFSTSSLNTGHYLATGTYSDKSYGTAQGVYISSFSAEKKEFIRFYNFLDFKNFLSYLSAKNQQKINNIKEKKETQGKELKMDYNMIIHDIIEHDNEFIFIGEAYYATYRSETYTTFVNGVATTRTRQVFDGYQYSHAVVASFDKLGNMNWSNSFEMWLSYKPYLPIENITVSTDNNKVSLLYATGSNIKSISFTNSGEIAEESSIEIIQTGDKNDVLKWTSDSSIEHWYHNVFITTGFQKIKNKEEEKGNKNRKVFFLNKIE